MKINREELRIQVRGILENYPRAKDSDEFLCGTLWGFEIMRYYRTQDIDSISAKEFLHLLMKGQLTNPESIRRTRQKLQEEFTNLRGKSYEKRHKKISEVREDLGYNNLFK